MSNYIKYKCIEFHNQMIQIGEIDKFVFKKDPTICCLQETNFRSKDTQSESKKDVKSYLLANGSQYQKKRSIHQENMTIINAQNTRAKYMKQVYKTSRRNKETENLNNIDQLN